MSEIVVGGPNQAPDEPEPQVGERNLEVGGPPEPPAVEPQFVPDGADAAPPVPDEEPAPLPDISAPAGTKEQDAGDEAQVPDDENNDVSLDGSVGDDAEGIEDGDINRDELAGASDDSHVGVVVNGGSAADASGNPGDGDQTSTAIDDAGTQEAAGDADSDKPHGEEGEAK